MTNTVKNSTLSNADGIFMPLLFVVISVVMYRAMLPLVSYDFNDFLLPWFQIINDRQFSAMAGEYANYSPPYLYLLGIASIFSGIGTPLVLIKSISIVFTIFAALVFYFIVRDITQNKRYATIAAFAFPLIPSVAINAAWWAQCDVIYTFFLLCSFLASLRKKPFLVILFFALAFSFKAQAVFFAPYLLYLMLNKEMPWKYLLLVPVIYCAMMLPAWLAGRSIVELLTIYLNQGSYYKSLSMNAPNPWSIVKKFDLLSYEVGVVVGVVAAIAGNLLLIKKALAAPYAPATIKLLILASTLLISPYLLPKMHDRYFFPADVFLILLAVIYPRFMVAAGSLQAASVAVALGFLGPLAHLYNIPHLFGAVLTTVAVFFICRPLLSYQREPIAPTRFAESLR